MLFQVHCELKHFYFMKTDKLTIVLVICNKIFANTNDVKEEIET